MEDCVPVAALGGGVVLRQAMRLIEAGKIQPESGKAPAGALLSGNRSVALRPLNSFWACSDEHWRAIRGIKRSPPPSSARMRRMRSPYLDGSKFMETMQFYCGMAMKLH
jgi:hypothetical protein